MQGIHLVPIALRDILMFVLDLTWPVCSDKLGDNSQKIDYIFKHYADNITATSLSLILDRVSEHRNIVTNQNTHTDWIGRYWISTNSYAT